MTKWKLIFRSNSTVSGDSGVFIISLKYAIFNRLNRALWIFKDRLKIINMYQESVRSGTSEVATTPPPTSHNPKLTHILQSFHSQSKH